MSIIASCAQEIKFHDWETGNCHGVHKLEKPKPGVCFSDLSWSCEGTYLTAVQVTGKTILLKPHLQSALRLDQVVNEREIINVGRVKSAQFSRTQNNLLALGTHTGHLMHYNLVSKYSTVIVEELPGNAHIICYAADDNYLAVACSNGQIFIVQAGVGITESYFVPNSDCVTSLTTHPTIPKFMAGGSDVGIIAVWDVTTSHMLMQTSMRNMPVLDIEFSPTDQTLTAIAGDQKISIYDMRAADCVHEKQFDVRLTTIAYAPRGNDIAVGTDQGHILSMDKRYLRSYRAGMKAHDFFVKKICFQQAGKINSNFVPMMKESQCSLFQEPERERLNHPLDIPDALSDIASYNKGDYIARLQHQTSSMDMGGNNERFAVKPCVSGMEKKGPTPTQQAVGEMSLYHIVDERSLLQIKQTVLQNTKEIIDKIVDQINNDFLKMRMNVSREFCTMEMRNRDRWQEFNDTLMKIACLDDRRLDEEMRMGTLHEEAVRDNSTPRQKPRNRRVPPPDIDIESDAPSEVSYDDNAYSSGQLLDQADIETDDYMENEHRLDKAMKITVGRVNIGSTTGSGFMQPSVSGSKGGESRVEAKSKRHTSKLPRQLTINQKKSL